MLKRKIFKIGYIEFGQVQETLLPAFSSVGALKKASQYLGTDRYEIISVEEYEPARTKMDSKILKGGASMVRILKSDNATDLEKQINDFLEGNCVRVVQICYSVARSDHSSIYSALILYQDLMYE